MKTMLAAFLPGNSTVELREVPVPTPGINQVLIKMKSSGICGSDVHYIYHQHRGLLLRRISHCIRGLLTVMNLVDKLLKPGLAVDTSKRVTGCWFTIFPAADSVPTADGVFRSPVPGRAKPPTAGSATGVMLNIY